MVTILEQARQIADQVGLDKIHRFRQKQEVLFVSKFENTLPIETRIRLLDEPKEYIQREFLSDLYTFIGLIDEAVEKKS